MDVMSLHLTAPSEREPVVAIIDDEPGIVDFVELGLRHEGWAVVSAVDGASGVSLVRRHSPNIVLLDVGLPNGDGFDTLRGSASTATCR